MTTLKLEAVFERYYELSRKASESVRTLALAGLAAVWLFSGGDQTDINDLNIPRALLVGGALFVTALTLDLLHSTVGSFMYGTWARRKVGSGIELDAGVELPSWLARVLWLFFVGKTSALIAGYVVLLWVLWVNL
jgi:hypothetical protein